MLHDLFEIKSFGKKDEIQFVLDLIKELQAPIPICQLKKYCTDHAIRFSISFDGIIRVLEIAGYIACTGDTVARNDRAEWQQFVIDDALANIPIQFLTALCKAGLITDFLNLSCIDYDPGASNVVIRNSSIPLQASAIKQFFIDLGVFWTQAESRSIYVLNPVFASFFERTVVTSIQDSTGFLPESGLTFEEFKKLQELKNQYGEQAEILVENYEKLRLLEHPQREKIKRISQLKVDAGYDIISFDSLESKELDRFIEVKSFSGEPQFYWSKNEVETAQIKGHKYFLYLVNRTNLDSEDYEPQVIQDPYTNVYKSTSWAKDAQNWLVKPVLDWRHG